jgi:hypothetical protein
MSSSPSPTCPRSPPPMRSTHLFPCACVCSDLQRSASYIYAATPPAPGAPPLQDLDSTPHSLYHRHLFDFALTPLPVHTVHTPAPPLTYARHIYTHSFYSVSPLPAAPCLSYFLPPTVALPRVDVVIHPSVREPRSLWEYISLPTFNHLCEIGSVSVVRFFIG